MAVDKETQCGEAFYATFCQPQFESLRGDQKEGMIENRQNFSKILSILEGECGLQARVREVENAIGHFRAREKWLLGIAAGILVILGARLILWTIPRVQASLIPPDPHTQQSP